MLRPDPRRSNVPALAMRDLTGFFEAMAAHDVRLLAGLAVGALAERLALDPPAGRPVLLFDLDGPGAPERIIEGAIAQLARVVAGTWPFAWGGEDFSAMRDDALSRAHLPIRLAALAKRVPRLSQGWAAEVVPKMVQHRQPRLGGAPADLEWAQLALAFAPAGLAITTSLAPDPSIEAQVRAIEWLAVRADVSFVVLSPTMPIAPALTRILYGARTVDDAPSEAPKPPPSPPGPSDADGPIVLALPPAPEGRPHPLSAIEQKLYQLIQADEEMRPLFDFNRTVPDLPQLQARADLIWAAGRIIVEIDGPEHRGAAKYRADRHRDYQLLCAGYRVLRMTNDDVAQDIGIALDKIRDVVRLVQREG